MPAQPNLSLINGLAALQCVTAADGAIGSREVARRLGLVHTRANRLLGTLAQLGLVEQDAERKYRVGPALHVLAAHGMRASGLLPAAMPTLARWHGEGFTVALGVAWQGQVCFLLHARPGQVLHESIGRHELWPADLTAAGLALISHQSDVPAPTTDTRIEDLVDDQRDLAAAVERTRRDGFALRRWRNGEVSLGVGVGRPPLAALAISHRHLDASALPALAARLAADAAAIAALLPGVRP